ncbi:MAG TPA: hypothetical protein DCM28_04665 [Phycisphaerales bacterium]|nr:hypothetical protein [Phycisphaerales bacterium]HCD31657.1 hypothetical protein [Phycisphaerales bacterium]|tara:strand:+ start:833 stop:1753 length:921 start_codon:yes stop_codon:yes gene_type:complete
MSDQTDSKPRRSHSRKFFWRGLTILLPSILTVWILIMGYQFVQQRIAEPINMGIRAGITRWSPLPVVLEEDLVGVEKELTQVQREQMRRATDPKKWLRGQAKAIKIQNLWDEYRFPFDLLGLIVAFFLIYIVGLLLGSYIGHSLYRRGEILLQRLPLFKQVYPSVKQITDFLVSDGNERLKKFSRVVAVQYPRRGIWSVGFITGDTMIKIQDEAGVPCATVFIPSSPTPFTGYTISVPRSEMIELPISVEEALRFTVSGGVVLPPSQTKQLTEQNVTADQAKQEGASISSDASPDTDSSTLAQSQS